MPGLTNEKPLTNRGRQLGGFQEFGWPSWAEPLRVPTCLKEKEVGFTLQPHPDPSLPSPLATWNVNIGTARRAATVQSFTVCQALCQALRLHLLGWSLQSYEGRAAAPFSRCKV